MPKPEYVNKVTVNANHQSREAFLLFEVNVPLHNDDFQHTGSECYEVISISVTESTLKGMHSAIGNVITQLNESKLMQVE